MLTSSCTYTIRHVRWNLLMGSQRAGTVTTRQCHERRPPSHALVLAAVEPKAVARHHVLLAKRAATAGIGRCQLKPFCFSGASCSRAANLAITGSGARGSTSGLAASSWASRKLSVQARANTREKLRICANIVRVIAEHAALHARIVEVVNAAAGGVAVELLHHLRKARHGEAAVARLRALLHDRHRTRYGPLEVQAGQVACLSVAPAAVCRPWRLG